MHPIEVERGLCCQRAEPVEREYFVTATIQTVVRAVDAYGAALDLKERLNELIAGGYAGQDPMHGAVIDSVSEIPEID